MKKLLILTLISAVLLSACVQNVPEGSGNAKETLNYVEANSTPDAYPDTSETKTDMDTGVGTVTESESKTDCEPETEKSEESAANATEAPDSSPKETFPEEVHVSGITLTVYELWLMVGESFMPIVTMTPENAADKGEIWISTDTAVATVDTYGNICGVGAGECTVTVTSTDNRAVSAEVKVHVTEPETEPSAPSEPAVPPSENGVTYINGILVVNKTYALPPDYNPGVDPEAREALYTMFADAAKEGLSLWVKSGVRTYADQKWQYNVYVERASHGGGDR